VKTRPGPPARILHYLNRVAKDPLTPKDWDEKHHGNHAKFVFWTITTLDQKLIEASGAVRKLFTSGTKTWWTGVVLPVLTAALKGQDFINGKNFTLTDVYLGYSLYFANNAGLLSDEASKPVAEYYARIAARPAFKKVYGDVVVKIHGQKH